MSETRLPYSTSAAYPAKKFTGYGTPKYIPVPDLFFDAQIQDLTEAELKVIL
jgi:hypothetical protein